MGDAHIELFNSFEDNMSKGRFADAMYIAQAYFTAIGDSKALVKLEEVKGGTKLPLNQLFYAHRTLAEKWWKSGGLRTHNHIYLSRPYVLTQIDKFQEGLREAFFTSFLGNIKGGAASSADKLMERYGEPA